MVQLKENVGKLKDMDVNIYAVSSDTVEHLSILHQEMKPPFPFLSDPEFKLIDHLDMRGESVAKRGYALMDQKGKVIFTEVNDHWGEQIDQTSKQIHDEYKKMEE
ncbi:redoxin domain-containing protein [Fictibacillus barbaricus]|uniref:Redoxin domain-containing protein n=1 Tax=Fictibacillus barbaricus TaxID=182136 RepID=A0ABS2ZDD9_9BACL|nr:redoxin domain-containing protein [Fictibacillus barbaricus]MBN3545349.1 redoxin domain-containing protein [Fictibacillus barbaricus]